jgi:hypothetical protein
MKIKARKSNEGLMNSKTRVHKSKKVYDRKRKWENE